MSKKNIIMKWSEEIPSTNKKDTPSLPGVYKIRRGNVLLYIGCTNNIKRRLCEHETINKYHRNGYKDLLISYIITDNYRNIEKIMINKLVPLENVKFDAYCKWNEKYYKEPFFGNRNYLNLKDYSELINKITI